jgi:hypothetical protein
VTSRRTFLATLGLGVPAVAAPRRVFSFLWDSSLVTLAPVALVDPSAPKSLFEPNSSEFIRMLRETYNEEAMRAVHHEQWPLMALV